MTSRPTATSPTSSASRIFSTGRVRGLAGGIAEIDLDARVAHDARAPRATPPPIAAGEKVAMSVRPEQMALSRTRAALPREKRLQRRGARS